MRRSEEALRRSEARNQALLNAIPDLMLRISRDGKFLDFRGAKGSVQTLPMGGFLGKGVQEVMPVDIAQRMMANIEDTLDTGRVSIFEYAIQREERTEYQEARIVASWEDEVLTIVRDITERKQAEKEREALIEELQDALAKVKTLSGLLPICASCKRIRDDNGYWQQIEAYIGEHSEAEFSHGICPECARRLYPDHYKGK
ncbi:MAG: PAS domain-containing protein [Deltaproteobacteria bacterium]|nr:PAS domain-containing protein [Deltaproteobacteria bacterium]